MINIIRFIFRIAFDQRGGEGGTNDKFIFNIRNRKSGYDTCVNVANFKNSFLLICS
jgi:hypothetical protein